MKKLLALIAFGFIASNVCAMQSDFGRGGIDLVTPSTFSAQIGFSTINVQNSAYLNTATGNTIIGTTTLQGIAPFEVFQPAGTGSAASVVSGTSFLRMFTNSSSQPTLIFLATSRLRIGPGTLNGGAFTEVISVDGATNNVGINNTAPSGPLVVSFPAAQTIAAGNTVTADACGSLKLITSAGAVTTDTTNTFSAPAAGNKGCIMHVCNSGSNNITLDNNALFVSAGGADVVVTANDCVTVGSTGASGVWYQLTALVAN